MLVDTHTHVHVAHSHMCEVSTCTLILAAANIGTFDGRPTYGRLSSARAPLVKCPYVGRPSNVPMLADTHTHVHVAHSHMCEVSTCSLILAAANIGTFDGRPTYGRLT